MHVTDAVLIVLAGLWAGVINTVVGSGTLVTFPILLATGIPPVGANIANNIGLPPGSVSGAVGYRRSLTMRSRPLVGLCVAAVLGGSAGAALLAVLPAAWFGHVAPFLVGAAVLLVIVEPTVRKRLPVGPGRMRRGPVWLLPLVVFATSVYGGYFGAGQGVILLAAMTLLMTETLHEVNAVKNVLQAADNLTSAAVFAVVAQVDWAVVGLLAAGAILGGQLGGRYGRLLPPAAVRGIVVVVGVIGIVALTR